MQCKLHRVGRILDTPSRLHCSTLSSNWQRRSCEVTWHAMLLLRASQVYVCYINNGRNILHAPSGRCHCLCLCMHAYFHLTQPDGLPCFLWLATENQVISWFFVSFIPYLFREGIQLLFYHSLRHHISINFFILWYCKKWSIINEKQTNAF